MRGQELSAVYNLNVPFCTCHNGDQVGMLSVLPLLYSLDRHPVTGRPVHSMWIFYLHIHINNHIITGKTGGIDEHNISVNKFNNKPEKHENQCQKWKFNVRKKTF